MAGQHSDFWSQRRAAVEAEAAEGAEAARRAALKREGQAAALAQADKSDAEILDELGLKDPDAMVVGDDFAAFLQGAVPAHLRQRALRRLWRSNPVLANLDGLVDHGDDFSDAATVTPGMMTAYRVGRGMAQHIAALADPVAAAPHPGLAQAEVSQAMVPTAAPEPERTPAPTCADVPADDRPAPSLPRHMRFAFAEDMP